MKKILNWKKFNEHYDMCHECQYMPCICHEEHGHEEHEHEEGHEFCPECGNDWDECGCEEHGEHHGMHEEDFPSHEDSRDHYDAESDMHMHEKKSTKGESYKKSGLKHPEKADLNKDHKISGYEKKRGKAVQDSMEEEEHEDKKEHKGLTAAQKKLPKGLQDAIMKKKK